MRNSQTPQHGKLWVISVAFLTILFGAQRRVLGYIDPGTGQQVWTTVGPLVGVLLACFGIILLPLRWGGRAVWGQWKRLPRWARTLTICVAVAGLVCGSMFLGMAIAGRDDPARIVETRKRAVEMTYKRALVIGMDGLDPKLLETMMGSGELPHFAELRREGTFSPLRTTIPPESPVAWLAAATGCNPGQTGVFDFIHRDPKTYLPDLSFPQSGKRSALSRTESPFVPTSDQPAMWDILSRRGIPVSVVRWPVTFPPTEVNGRMLSGLGTPDVCGGMGAYQFFTTADIGSDDEAPDRVTQVEWDGDRIGTKFAGPKVLSFGGTKTSTIPMVIERGDSGDAVTVAFGKGKPISLKVGLWSDWQTVSFPGGFSRACPAMVRMYLTSLEPQLNLYISPVNIDPSDPAFPMSSPKEFSKELAEQVGLYATLGMPEDNQAVQHGRIPLSAFLDLCDDITDQRVKMFEHELDRLEEGGLFFVFDTSDRIQHMFWAATDAGHPAHTAELEAQYGDIIRKHYRRMDTVIGKALKAAKDGETAIFVLSDHGFTSFRRAVHLNRWLVEKGYMVLKDGENEGTPLLKSVDWSKTRAYAVGFCSLYINMEGREGQGCVAQEEYKALREQLARELKLWVDQTTADPVIRNAYFRDDIYRGDRLDEAPDIVVGYYPGFRASWQTALGAAPVGDAVVDNEELWAGDHLVDAPCVPGIFLSNLKADICNPSLIDVAPTVLKTLGITPTPEMGANPIP